MSKKTLHILAVDLGNYNIKTSESTIFRSTYTLDNIGIDPLATEKIEYNGNTYLIGKGEFDTTFNKAKKEYLPNLLYAIASTTPQEIEEIGLVLGVPIDNLGLSDAFKSDLDGKEFQFKFNGADRKIKISKLGIVGEGLSSYYTLDDKTREKDLLIIDVGGRTVNVVTYKNKKLDQKFTIPTGTITYHSKIAERENFKGDDIKVEVVREYISKNIITDLEDIAFDFIKGMLNQIGKIDTRPYKVLFTGGGSIDLLDYLKKYEYPDKMKNFKDFELIDNPVFSNASGNKVIGSIKWR